MWREPIDDERPGVLSQRTRRDNRFQTLSSTTVSLWSTATLLSWSTVTCSGSRGVALRRESRRTAVGASTGAGPSSKVWRPTTLDHIDCQGDRQAGGTNPSIVGKRVACGPDTRGLRVRPNAGPARQPDGGRTDRLEQGRSLWALLTRQKKAANARTIGTHSPVTSHATVRDDRTLSSCCLGHERPSIRARTSHYASKAIWRVPEHRDGGLLPECEDCHPGW